MANIPKTRSLAASLEVGLTILSRAWLVSTEQFRCSRPRCRVGAFPPTFSSTVTIWPIVCFFLLPCLLLLTAASRASASEDCNAAICASASPSLRSVCASASSALAGGAPPVLLTPASASRRSSCSQRASAARRAVPSSSADLRAAMADWSARDRSEAWRRRPWVVLVDVECRRWLLSWSSLSSAVTRLRKAAMVVSPVLLVLVVLPPLDVVVRRLEEPDELPKADMVGSGFAG